MGEMPTNVSLKGWKAGRQLDETVKIVLWDSVNKQWHDNGAYVFPERSTT